MPKGILAIGVVIHKAGLHLDTSRCERARGRRDRSTVLAKLRLNHTIATEVPTQPNPPLTRRVMLAAARSHVASTPLGLFPFH